MWHRWLRPSFPELQPVADTIFALSSGRPPAAVSVIRISGANAHDAARQIAGTLPGARTAAVRELRKPSSGDLLDEALVVRFDSPKSFTGEDIVEFQCHGGRAVVDSILRTLAEIAGLREAEPGEFTRRAFANGRIDLTEAEGLADLIEAETESQRRAAILLAEGGLRKEIARWQELLLSISARVERAIDYDEEDDVLDPSIGRDCAALAANLKDWLSAPRVEPLKDGIRVVVAGPPNTGKSSLINRIVGEERVIVTDLPGTTRDHVDVPLSLGGIPVRLTDTAGLRETEDRVEAIGVERAERLVEIADVLLWLGEPDGAPLHPHILKLRGKADLGAGIPDSELLGVSALTGEGVAVLLQRIEAMARSILPSEDSIALNRRQAQLIGEAAEALWSVASATDLVVIGELVRRSRSAFDRLTGRAGVEDVLDALFGRFCLGK